MGPCSRWSYTYCWSNHIYSGWTFSCILCSWNSSSTTTIQVCFSWKSMNTCAFFTYLDQFWLCLQFWNTYNSNRIFYFTHFRPENRQNPSTTQQQHLDGGTQKNDASSTGSVSSAAAGPWTLQIKYVQARDAGVYECQISTEPKISARVYLHVVGELKWKYSFTLLFLVGFRVETQKTEQTEFLTFFLFNRKSFCSVIEIDTLNFRVSAHDSGCRQANAFTLVRATNLRT